jgi:hypothetical protein
MARNIVMGRRCWRSHKEVPGIIKEGETFMPHFLEIQLRYWVCYILNGCVSLQHAHHNVIPIFQYEEHNSET